MKNWQIGALSTGIAALIVLLAVLGVPGFERFCLGFFC